MNLGEIDTRVVVKAIDQYFEPSKTTLDQLPEELFRWELGGLADPLGQLINWLWEQISDALSILEETLKGVINSVKNSLIGWITWLKDQVTGAIDTVTSWVTSIYNYLSDIYSFISTRLSWVLSSISSISGSLTSVFSYLSSIWDRLTSLASNISSYFSQVLAKIGEAVSKMGEVVQQVSKAVGNAVSPLIENLRNWVAGAIQGISSAIAGMSSFLRDFFESMVNRLGELGTMVWSRTQWLWELFNKTIAETFDKIRSWIDEATKRLRDLGVVFQGYVSNLASIWHWLTTSGQSFIDNSVSFFAEAAKFFTETLPKWLSEFSSYVIGFFKDPARNISKALSDAWQSFHETVIAPVKDWLWENVGKPVSEAVAPISQVLEPIGETLNTMLEKISDFFKDPTSHLKKAGEWIAEAGGHVLKTLYEGLKTLWDWIGDAAKWLWEALTSLGEGLLSLTGDVAKTLMNTVVGVVRGISSAISSAISAIISPTLEKHSKAVEETIKELHGTPVVTPIEIVMRFMPTIAPFLFGPRVLGGILLGIAESIREITINLRPFGLGIQVPVRPGAILGEIGKAIGESGAIIAHSLAYGMGIWFWQPFSRALNMVYRNILPIEIPTLDIMQTLVRRTYATPEFEKFRKYMAEYMAMTGFSDDVIYWVTGTYHDIQPTRKPPEKVTIKNRFGQTVEIPIPLIFSMPTPSELARMMIKDIFGAGDEGFKNFVKAMKMHGYTESLAFLYYLLHFRYPSPEQLWLIWRRAEAGMLWHIEVSPQDMEWAMPHYMKWHDYYDKSWFAEKPGFPADRDMIIELMADIPTRIDVRWMYKWGIADEEFVKRVVTARGMHPKYVESIAIAEMMNALAEERTYARTGVIELVREGLLTIQEAKNKLSNLTKLKLLGQDVTVKFLPGEVELLLIRASADIERENARRKIERLRNLYVAGEIGDESLEAELKEIVKNKTVYDTILTEIKARKIRDQLYYTHRQILRTVDAICSLYEEGFITREKAQEEIKATAGNVLTDRQIQIILKESEQRIQRGIKRNKLKAIVNKLRRGAITPSEAKESLTKELGLPEDLAESIIEAQGRAYALSISTLLAYADVIEVPEQLLTKKLEALGVPEDEKDLILQVFKVRPMRSELSREISAAIADFVDGYMAEQELRNMLSKAFKKPEEINVLVSAAKIRRENKLKDYKIQAILAKLRRGETGVAEAKSELQKIIVVPELVDALIARTVGEIVREYTLSISTLLSYASIIEISEDLLKARMQKLNIPKEDQEIILQVFRIRPIRDELARQVRAILDDFEDGYIDEKTAKEQLAKCYKKQREINILIETAKIEKEASKKKLKIDAILNKLKRGATTISQAKQELSNLIADKELVELIIEKNARIYTISVSTLASMKEYIPIPDDLIKKKLEALGVPEDEQKYWIPYIFAREISSELGKYVAELGNLYVEGKIAEQEFKRELDNVATLWGRAKELLGVEWVVYSPEERDILLQVYKMRKLRKQRQR